MGRLKALENAQAGEQLPLDEFLGLVKFNDAGLVPAVAQDHANGDVLMLAWMDRKAIETTLADGFATYYSRSRAAYWRKGETSGHLQRLIDMRFDCDADTILLSVDQTGCACHTNRRDCFYLKVENQNVVVTESQQ